MKTIFNANKSKLFNSKLFNKIKSHTWTKTFIGNEFDKINYVRETDKINNEIKFLNYY